MVVKKQVCLQMVIQNTVLIRLSRANHSLVFETSKIRGWEKSITFVTRYKYSIYLL